MEAPLEIAIKVLDELENEVHSIVRNEFSEYSDRLDEVIDLLREVDRSDVDLLVSQMGRMQEIMEMGTTCTCEADARWHACLSRLSTAVAQAALRFNAESTKLYCETLGISFEAVVDFLNKLEEASQESVPLPELPEGVTVPDDLSQLESK